ncbi:hypothetical protein ACLIBG_05525 [Virgibacillus sp. W0181]|uniref:hypothetical protein n=1 Tax=Virgibacillus sp. W0181 TaxID=3391581 RepID=UPI003F48595D
MDNWKQAFWLAKYEFRHSPLTLFVLIGILLTALLLVVPTIPDYIRNAEMGIDLFFILFFMVASQWARPKIFREQKLGNGRYASYFLIALNQLPVPKEVVVKYRYLTYIIISVPIQILFLTILYILTPALQTELSIGTYAVFSIIWICFGVYLGCQQLVAEAGANLFFNIIITLFLLGPIIITLFIILFYKWYSNGFVNWTMFIAEDYPLLSIIVSLLLTAFGAMFWMKRMKRKMGKTDYL